MKKPPPCEHINVRLSGQAGKDRTYWCTDCHVFWVELASGHLPPIYEFDQEESGAMVGLRRNGVPFTHVERYEVHFDQVDRLAKVTLTEIAHIQGNRI